MVPMPETSLDWDVYRPLRDFQVPLNLRFENTTN